MRIELHENQERAECIALERFPGVVSYHPRHPEPQRRISPALTAYASNEERSFAAAQDDGDGSKPSLPVSPVTPNAYRRLLPGHRKLVMLCQTTGYSVATTDGIGATRMKRLRGQMMSDFMRVMLFVGVPAAIGIGAGRLAVTWNDSQA
jgi:hypothetical protein